MGVNVEIQKHVQKVEPPLKESYEITKVSNDGLKIVITKTQLLD